MRLEFELSYFKATDEHVNHYTMGPWPFICYYHTCVYQGGACGVRVIVIENGHGETSSNKADCISHSTNTLGKGMNPIILLLVMGK